MAINTQSAINYSAYTPNEGAAVMGAEEYIREQLDEEGEENAILLAEYAEANDSPTKKSLTARQSQVLTVEDVIEGVSTQSEDIQEQVDQIKKKNKKEKAGNVKEVSEKQASEVSGSMTDLSTEVADLDLSYDHEDALVIGDDDIDGDGTGSSGEGDNQDSQGQDGQDEDKQYAEKKSYKSPSVRFLPVETMGAYLKVEDIVI